MLDDLAKHESEAKEQQEEEPEKYGAFYFLKLWLTIVTIVSLIRIIINREVIFSAFYK